MTPKKDTTGNIVPSAANDPAARRLFIDFDLYTEGDKEYKKELCTLIIENLREFQQSLLDSVTQKNPIVFLKASHKVKVTLGMLEDKEFEKVVKDLETGIVNSDGDSHFVTLSRQFQNLCNVTVISLMMETNV